VRFAVGASLIMASLAMATQLASVTPRLPLLSETSRSTESTLSLWANAQPCRMVTMHRKSRVLCGLTSAVWSQRKQDVLHAAAKLGLSMPGLALRYAFGVGLTIGEKCRERLNVVAAVASEIPSRAEIITGFTLG